MEYLPRWAGPVPQKALSSSEEPSLLFNKSLKVLQLVWIIKIQQQNKESKEILHSRRTFYIRKSRGLCPPITGDPYNERFSKK